MTDTKEKKDCARSENCECKNNEEPKKENVQQVNAYSARDPNNNLIAVFEQNVKCDKCGKLHFHQLIVNSGVIFQFAQVFDNMIEKAMSEKKIVTPGGNKTKGGLVVPGR